MGHEPPVLLDLSGIIAEPGSRGSFRYTFDLPLEEEIAYEGPVNVALEAHNTGSALLVYGTFRGKALLSCARCLTDVVVDVQGRIDEQFSLPGITDPDLKFIDQEEPKESAFANQILDVTDLVRQQVLISLPMRVLCMDACKGICPSCGQNLNEGTCQCAEPAAHPAWETLRELVEKTSSQVKR